MGLTKSVINDIIVIGGNYSVTLGTVPGPQNDNVGE